MLWWMIRMLRLVHRLRYETCEALPRVLLQTALCLEKKHAQSQIEQMIALQDMVNTDIGRLEK